MGGFTTNLCINNNFVEDIITDIKDLRTLQSFKSARYYHLKNKICFVQRRLIQISVHLKKMKLC